MSARGSFSTSCLLMQGYVGTPEEARRELGLAIRFTPAVCTGLVIAGLALRSPLLLGAVAVIALIGALLPSGHPLDLLYNHGVRYLVGGRALPPNPAPRRFACFVAMLMNAGSAASFAAGYPAAGFALGGIVVAAGLTVSLSNWCLGSWLYRQVFRRPATPAMAGGSR